MALTRTLNLALAAASANNIATSQSLASAGNLTLNGSTVSGGFATLDTARRVLITSAGNDSGISWTVTGTGANGATFSETLTGGNAVGVYTKHDFATVTSITGSGASASTVTAGTNTIGSTQPWVVDEWANPAEFGYGITVSGSATYLIEGSMDDLKPQWDINTNTPNWQTVVDGTSGSGSFGTIANQPLTMLRLTNLSGTGTVTAKFLQAFKAGRI